MTNIELLQPLAEIIIASAKEAEEDFIDSAKLAKETTTAEAARQYLARLRRGTADETRQ